MNQTLKETFSYFGSNPFNRYQSKRGSTRNTSPIQENSLRIREIAQQNIYIMFPNARDPLTGIASQNNRFNQKINSKSTTQLPKLQAGQENFSKTISTRASLTQKTFNKTILEIGEKNETLVKPFMTTKRSEVNQIQGMFKSVRKSPKQDYFGLDNSLEYDFPFHQIVDFVKNHSQGFENKQNTDLHKHYQRMYIKNKFKIKKLRHDKKERIIKIRERMIQDNKQLEERRLQIQQMLINHSQSNKETTKSNNKTPLQVKQFILQQNIKDLSEFDEILNKYEQYFQTNNKESVDSEIKKEDFNRLRDLYNQTTTKQQEVQQFQYKEGGLLHKLMIKQNQKKELHVVKTQNDSLAQRDLYEDYKKSVKTVEDIFIEQIIYFIRQKGIVALSPVDYFNFRGILINRKNQYKQMLLELDDIIDIKRHIKYNTEGQRKKKQEEQEEEQAKFYITQEQSSIVRKSQIETNDQTYQDSILNYKNSLSTSIGTERAALHPKILEFIPPNSFLPRLQDQQSLSKRNFQMNSDFYNSFKNNTSIENNSNNINDSDKFGINNDQSSMFQLSTHRIEDNNSIKKIIEEGMTTERGKSVQNLTERSKESQDEYDADLNQLQYLMELNNQNENTERDQEEAMRMKLQIIKLMMKDDKKSIMKKLTERILSKIEQRREVLLRQIEKEENKEKLEELQQELQREIKKKNVQLLLLTHTNSLKKVSHRLMYEYDQQAQYYRELSNSASLAGSELVNSPTNEWQDSISPLAFETIFNLIDDADDVVANFVINQMDKQGTLENLLNHLKIQESQTGTIDIDKVKDYILMINNSIPQEEIKNLEMKNGKIVGRIKKQEKNRKSQEQVQIHQDEVIEPVEDDKQTDQAEKQEQENPDYYKFYQKNKPEKIQIRLKDKTSDESRKMRLKSDQSPHDSEYSEDASGLSADNVSRTSKKDLNKRQIQNSKSIKNKNKINVYQDLNNSKLKDLARVGSFYSETSQSSNNIRSKQNSNFQRELINNESTARKEVLLNLKGYENAQDILLGEFTAEEQIKAQEELRLRREEEQRKIKTIGKKMNFTDNEDDPELQRLKELIQFSETQKRNQTFNVKMQHKKTNKSKFARSNSQVNEENQLQVVDQQQQQQRRRSTIDIPQISQIKYGNKSGSKLGNGNEDIPQFYKDLLKGKSKQNDVYEEIEIEVTDTSDDDDDEPQYDENGKLIPKQKKKKKKILLVKKGENGAITLDLQQQLPQGFKITKDGKIVKVEKVTLEDGTVIEIEKEVKQNKLRSLIQDENGNMIQKVENLKIKKFKVVKRILENGTVEETEVTDNESELNESISTDKISVSIDESASRPLTPNTRQQMIYEKQKKKKEQMKQELNDSPRKKKKIIKRVIKSNGEIEEIITEVDDPIGGEEIQEYDSKGNLTKQLFIPAEQKKDLNKKITKKQTNSPSSQNTAQNNGGSTKNKKKQKENVQEEWFNEDGTPWVSSKNKKNQGGANNQEGINSTTNRRKQDSNASNLSKTQKIEKEVKEEAPKPPEKIKQIINGREIEYMPLASNESFHSEDIPSSLIDDSQSIKSADLNQMDADKKKMYQKIKKKREQAKQKKIREQLEKEIKDFRKNNVFTELEQLMKQNLSLRELKRQIEVYLEMLKGKNIDDETKYNIFLYLQRKEQLVTFLIAFEDNFESNVMIRPEVMQEIRQFLKKRVSLVKADNEKKMKFTRPVVMPDGNGLSLFEEFKGDNISEWEIRQIMKYASYNQDVQKIIDRLRKFKQDTNAIIQLKLMLKRLETKVIQTDLDYLHIMNLNEDYIQDLQNGDNQDRSKKSILYQSKDKIIKDTQDQFNQKIEALRKCKQKNPEKFQGLLTQFQTVKSDSNIFKALKNEIAEKAEKLNMHTAKVTQAMWTNRMKNFGVTKVNFNMVKTQKIPNV